MIQFLSSPRFFEARALAMELAKKSGKSLDEAPHISTYSVPGSGRAVAAARVSLFPLLGAASAFFSPLRC